MIKKCSRYYKNLIEISSIFSTRKFDTLRNDHNIALYEEEIAATKLDENIPIFYRLFQI